MPAAVGAGALSALILPLAGAAAQPASTPASAAAPRKSGDPSEVFRGICLEGGLSMTREQAAPVALGALPAGARAALGAYAFRTDSVPLRVARRLRPEEVPNAFFQLDPGNAYLMAPRADAAPETTGRQCAVFWRGAHWPELRATLRPWLFVPDPGAPPNAYRGRVAIEVVLRGQLISVASHNGWTMMRTAPVESVASAAAPPQPGDPRVAAPAAAIAAAQTCREAPLDFEAARRYVRSHGWSETDAGLSRRMRAMIMPFPVFERGPIVLTLLPQDSGRSGSCGITAPMASGTVWADLLAAATAAFGRAPLSSEANEARWTFDDRSATATLVDGALIIRFRPPEPAAEPKR
ncbi:MAG TPA: hypothetical protein VGW40_08540 [Allosphingosinicella sp.]|nr:hypothetical protein [Allosphingosinicella sp.]